MNRAKGALLAAAVAVLALSGAAAANAPAPTPPRSSPHSAPHNVAPEQAVREIGARARRGTARTRPTRPLPPRPQSARGLGHLPADAPGDLATSMEATGQTFVGAASFVTVPQVGTPDGVSDALTTPLSVLGFPTVRLDGGLPQTVTNIASVSTANYDPDTTNNVALKSATVNPPNADLTVTGIDSPDPVLFGSKVAYVITVVNNGPLAGPTPTLTDTPPDGWTFVSASGPGGCSAGATITCQLSTLNPKQSAKFTITLGTPAEVGPPATVDNQASATSSMLDMNPANNLAVIPTTVNPPYADLVLTGKAAPSPVAKLGTVTYTFTVKNNGPQAAANASLHVDVPDGLAGVNAVGTGCSAGGSVNCSLGTIVKGASKVVTITGKAPNTGGTTLTAQGSTGSDTADPTGSNNSTNATTTTKSS
jgi:uncharacterized repeat protein (TIGR01451 family)